MNQHENLMFYCTCNHRKPLERNYVCIVRVSECVCVWLCLLESIVQYIRQPCHVHVAAAGYRRCSCLWVMRWHEQHGLRAKRRSSMSRFTISPSFSLLSLLPLSSLLDDPSCSLPTRLSFCPSSRVAVFHFFRSFFTVLHPAPCLTPLLWTDFIFATFTVHGGKYLQTEKVRIVRYLECSARQGPQTGPGLSPYPWEE